MMRKKTILLTILIFFAAWVGLPTAHGYLHPADALILLAALMLPLPQALLAAGIASLAADLVKGYLLLAPVTLVIKLLIVLAAFALMRLPTAKKYPSLVPAPALFLPVAGYYLAEGIFQLTEGTENAFIIAAGTLQKDLLQAAGSVVLFIILYDFWQGIAAGRTAIRSKKEGEQNNE